MISGFKLKHFSLFFLLVSLFACKNEKDMIAISKISMNAKLQRFDKEFYNSDTSSIKDIRVKYSYLFPGDEPDSLWLSKKNDSLTQVLYQESQSVFGNFNKEFTEIETLFRYVKYYYPKFKEPTVVTLISELDMDNQIIYADSLLLISLDTYLGKEKKYYSNYPVYLRPNFDKSHIVNDVAMAIAYEVSPHLPYRLFLERIIASGKLKYAMHQFLPKKSESAIIGYSSVKMEWAFNNEEMIWKYFIEKEYLYSTDKELQSRFIDLAPFSKFYLVSDNESPGQIGIWLGYQIVKAYMENNTVSLPTMMATPPIDIFKNSKYKPRR